LQLVDVEKTYQGVEHNLGVKNRSGKQVCDCIGSCKSYCYTITSMTAPTTFWEDVPLMQQQNIEDIQF
jgi:hypothetical protein